jgi:hypothetical protein
MILSFAREKTPLRSARCFLDGISREAFAQATFYGGLLLGGWIGTWLILLIYGMNAAHLEKDLPHGNNVVDIASFRDVSTVEQPFYCSGNNLVAARITVVTWAQSPQDVPLNWKLSEIMSDGERVVSEGVVSPAGCKDWGPMSITFAKPLDSKDRFFVLRVYGRPDLSFPFGVPLYQTTFKDLPKATKTFREHALKESTGSLAIRLVFGG